MAGFRRWSSIALKCPRPDNISNRESRMPRAVQAAADPGAGAPLRFQLHHPRQITPGPLADSARGDAEHQPPCGLRMVQGQLEGDNSPAGGAYEVDRLAEPGAEGGRVPVGQVGDGHARGRVYPP
jgi:hypothetical protein